MWSHQVGRGAVLLGLGSALVTVAHLSGFGSTPVYDGLPVPADRYRYLEPPAGVTSPGLPFSARTTFQLIGGANPTTSAATGEFPPQAEVWLQHGDVDGMAAGIPPVTAALMTITPVPPPAVPPPAGRQFHGNVYALKVVADGRSLRLRTDARARVELRQPRISAADPRIAVLNGDHWQVLDTHPAAGAGVLSALLPQLGNVVIVERTSGFVASQGHSLLWLLLGIALCVAAVVVVVSVRRLR